MTNEEALSLVAGDLLLYTYPYERDGGEPQQVVARFSHTERDRAGDILVWCHFPPGDMWPRGGGVDEDGFEFGTCFSYPKRFELHESKSKSVLIETSPEYEGLFE